MTNREIDALVATKVMGFKVIGGPTQDVLVNSPTKLHFLKSDETYLGSEGATVDDEFKILPHYSTDIAAAWEVVERVDDVFVLAGFPGAPIGWSATFSVDFEASADTAPMAICLAALKSVGVEVEV